MLATLVVIVYGLLFQFTALKQPKLFARVCACGFSVRDKLYIPVSVDFQ